MLYLDYAATTPMRPEVWEAMAPFVSDQFGNSSGSHAVSRVAKNALEAARERAAGLLGCQPTEIVFTGGGTESDNLAVKGASLAGGRRGGVVTVATEHEAVLEAADFLERFGCPLSVVGVDAHGRVDPKELVSHVTEDTAVVSVMLVNNETGTVQPVAEVAEAVRSANPGTVIHTDAIQAYPFTDVSVDELGVDLLSLTAHKFGGPKGSGLLYVRSGVNLEAVLHGGGQELGRRSGTHNTMGAVGLVAAMDAANQDRERFMATVAGERLDFEKALEAVSVRSVPHEISSPHHSHLRFEGVRNETLLVRLDRRNLAASAASACQSGATTVSHVLTAMGYDSDSARECVRFSFGWSTQPGDGRTAANAVLDALDGMQ